MDREQAQRLVAQVVRDRVFDGEERELAPDATLAELGFDSLALVTVVSGLEAAVERAFPETMWEERQNLRVEDLVDAVVLQAAPGEPHRAPPAPPAPAHPPSEQAPSAVRAGLAGIARRAFSRLDVVIVERLLDGPLPKLEPPADVVIRRATAADEGAVAALWPGPGRAPKLRQFRSWLADGYTCLAAFAGQEVVAIDWLNDVDPDGGVTAAPGTCLGISLQERWDHAGRGIGLALVARSLAVSKEAGYARQAAYVAAANTRMRAACTGLLGFSEVASARRTTVAGRTRWTWTRDGAHGSGPVLQI